MGFGTIPSQPAPGTKTGPYTTQRYPAGDPRRYISHDGVPTVAKQPVVVPPRPAPVPQLQPKPVPGPAPIPGPAPRPISGPPPAPLPGLPYGGPISMPGGPGLPPNVSIGGGPAPIGMPPAQNPIQSAPIGGTLPPPTMPTNGMGGGKASGTMPAPMPTGPAQSGPIGWSQDPTTGQWNSQTPGLPSYGAGQFAGQGQQLPPGVGMGFGFNPNTGGFLGGSMPQPLPNFGGALGTTSPLLNTIQNR